MLLYFILLSRRAEKGFMYFLLIKLFYSLAFHFKICLVFLNFQIIKIFYGLTLHFKMYLAFLSLLTSYFPLFELETYKTDVFFPSLAYNIFKMYSFIRQHFV